MLKEINIIINILSSYDKRNKYMIKVFDWDLDEYEYS